MTTGLGLALLVTAAACKPLPATSWVAPQPATTVAPAPAPTPIPGPPPGVIGIAAPAPRVPENAYGADDRQFVTSAEFPWSAVGKLSTGCTATLIDRQLIITASHCFFDPTGAWQASDIFFYPNLVGGVLRDRARITFAWTASLTPFAQTATLQDDWAIGLLNVPLGDRYRWIGIRNYLAVPGDQVTLTGYSSDVRGGDTATTHVDCHVRGTIHGQLTHDCDMTRGASGGPLWSAFGGELAIVGINSFEYTADGSEYVATFDDAHPNGAVPATRFVETAVWAVASY